MAEMISYSISTTVINASATSLTITPPPAYSNGDLLVLSVTGGSATAGGAVSATTPSGWTRLSTSGAGLSVFTKTAGTEPASYTITMSVASTISAYIAAYPAATVSSSSFSGSGTNITSYTSTWPSGVSTNQVVLVVAAAVATGSNAGYQNINYPAGLTSEIPVFGQALPTQPGTVVYPCAIGLNDVTGSVMGGLPAPVFTSPQDCIIYTGFIVLTVTGAVSIYTVTAVSVYPMAVPGMMLAVKMLSGAASAADIFANGAFTQFYAKNVLQAPQAAITPTASGSYVYGAVTENLNVTAGTTYTANASTTFIQNNSSTGNGSVYGTFRSKNATTANTPVTLGGSTPDNSTTTAALAEIFAAPGSTLTEIATAIATGLTPGNFNTGYVSQTAIFTAPPAVNTLLVAMVSTNSYFTLGNASVTITDSGNLTWTALAEVFYPSYSGVWVGSSATGSVTVGLLTAQVGVAAYSVTPPGTNAILDEANDNILDEAGNDILDESGGGGLVTLPLAQMSIGAYPLSPTTIPSGTNQILDEASDNILDEAGNYVLDESNSTTSLTAAQATLAAYPLVVPVTVTVQLPTAQVIAVVHPLASSTDVAGFWQQQAPIGVTGNGNYTVSAWIWTEQTDMTIGIYWLSADDTADGSSAQTVTIQPVTWTQITFTATAPSDAVNAYPFLNVVGAGVSFYAEHVILVDANAEVPYLPNLGLDYDNTYLQNVTQATLTQGPNTLIAPVEKDTQSIASYLSRGPQSVTVNGSSAQDAYDVAYWYLAKYKQPQLRTASVTVDAATNPQIFSSILQFDLSAVATLNRRPIGAPPYSLLVICEQVTHSIGPGVWSTSYQLSPYIQENTVLIPDGPDEDTLGSSTLAW
jgi:hypothetical protein